MHHSAIFKAHLKSHLRNDGKHLVTTRTAAPVSPDPESWQLATGGLLPLAATDRCRAIEHTAVEALVFQTTASLLPDLSLMQERPRLCSHEVDVPEGEYLWERKG
jgi:hypothetical protein